MDYVMCGIYTLGAITIFVVNFGLICLKTYIHENGHAKQILKSIGELKEELSDEMEKLSDGELKEELSDEMEELSDEKVKPEIIVYGMFGLTLSKGYEYLVNNKENQNEDYRKKILEHIVLNAKSGRKDELELYGWMLTAIVALIAISALLLNNIGMNLLIELIAIIAMTLSASLITLFVFYILKCISSPDTTIIRNPEEFKYKSKIESSDKFWGWFSCGMFTVLSSILSIGLWLIFLNIIKMY